MQYKAMSTPKRAQSTNAAASNSAKAKLTPSSSTSNEKFSAAGQPAGTTSASMLGETRYNPNATNTVPFETLPPFPKKNKMDNDERSSISDTDDAVLANDDKSKCSPDAAKKTRGRVRIQMEYIQNKLRRYTTFSKRKSGIMKKAYELSTLTGTQVMLLVASETGHVYTFATPKLQPMITSEAGKALIQTCLHQPDPPVAVSLPTGGEYDVRMSAGGYEETELSYGGLPEEDSFKNGLNNVLPVSTSAQMPSVMNPGPIVTIPHGMSMMQVPTFATSVSIPETHMVAMNPIMAHSHHQMVPVQQLTCSPQSMSPHHSPPPSYSPPHQPPSPPRTYPGSPSAVSYSQSSHVPHQPVMMDELGSPSHMSKSPDHYLGHYDRSPSRSPIQHRYNSPHHTSPQTLYSASNGSPPMGGHHSPPMRI